MKCISCEIEINPQWRHAIDKNVCPFCGKCIMDEQLKSLFSDLCQIMDALRQYPNELDDWMISNHNYIKTDSPDIIRYLPKEDLKKYSEEERDFQKRKEGQKFTVKVKTDQGEEDIVAEKIQSEERTNEFFKRAEAIKNSPQAASQINSSAGFQSMGEKTEYLKKMAQQIKKAGAQGLTVSGATMSIPPDMLEEADPEAVEEFQSIISGGSIASSVDSDLDDDLPGGEYIIQANLAAAKSKQGSSTGDYNPKDAAKLQNLQNRVNQSRKNMVNGTGGKGSFSRT